MTTETHHPADDLRHLIAMGSLTEDALHAVTQIEAGKLAAFLDSEAPAGIGVTTTDTTTLTPDESARLSILSAQLTGGLAVSDDERLRSIFETLTVECGLTLDNLARLTGTDSDTLQIVLRAPEELSAGVKYRLALSGSYLITAANRARGQ